MLNLLGRFRPYLAAGAVLAFVAWTGAVYFKGRADKAHEQRIDELTQSLEAEGIRDEIETDTDRLDAIERCLALGGTERDCETLINQVEE